jgi:3-oxoacyl-[acyl-carrier protein] reductase
MKIGGASAPLVDPTNDLSASIPSFHPFTERLGSEGLPVHACACDVADEFEVAEMAAWAGDRLRQVDILVNCAGMVLRSHHQFCVATCLQGRARPRTLLRGQGRHRRVHPRPFLRGSASRADGQRDRTGARRDRTVDGSQRRVRAMKVAELPIGRFGKVHEIAPTALLLASDAGAFYAGQTLSPNGGDVMV